jgi:hypothetical protein
MTDGLDRATSAATLTKAEFVSICLLIAGFIAVVGRGATVVNLPDEVTPARTGTRKTAKALHA